MMSVIHSHQTRRLNRQKGKPMIDKTHTFDLQLFSEAPSMGGGDVSGGNPGVETSQASGQMSQSAPGNGWDQARQQYRAEINSEISRAVQDRVKNLKGYQTQMEQLAPVLQQMYGKYELQEGDIDGLVKAVQSDDSLLAQEAMDRGMTVEQLREVKALEHDRSELQRIQQEQAIQQKYGAHLQKLEQQMNQLRGTFPNADLRTELQNPQFARLTSPEVGVDVETAFWICHRNELQPMAMQIGAQRSLEKLSQAQQRNASRPMENGLTSPAGVSVNTDPSKWTKKERAEIRKRVAMGEKIVL